MNCTKPIQIIHKNEDPKRFRHLVKDGIHTMQMVPCGKCYHCKKNRKRQWAVRMLHELYTTSNNDAMFITLTYSDDHLPYFIPDQSEFDKSTFSEEGTDGQRSDEYYLPTLRKRDLQLFFKRLRNILHDLPEKRRIKYYASGEYGETYSRPHYHAIIFGLDYFNPDHKKLIMDSWPYCDWENPSIAVNSFGQATYKSMLYVSGYITSKVYGELADQDYAMFHREPPFQVQSQGIGLDYFKKFSRELLTDMSVETHGRKHSLPRYYIKKARDEGLITDAKTRGFITEYELEKQTEEQIMENDTELIKHFARKIGLNYIGEKTTIEELKYSDLWFYEKLQEKQIEPSRRQRDADAEALILFQKLQKKSF